MLIRVEPPRQAAPPLVGDREPTGVHAPIAADPGVADDPAFFFSKSGSAPTPGSDSIMWPPPDPGGRRPVAHVSYYPSPPSPSLKSLPTPIIPLTPGHSDMNWPKPASSGVSATQPPSRIIKFLAGAY